LDTKEPKHGKEDPDNAPHVGGNTWAGGTGGRDTAGLGGKGGPYRLDKGHEVHQLSDEEKNAVPDHIQRAAREMGKKAFQEKLKEIGMSGYDASLYDQFYNSVSRQIQSLRIILGNLQAKNKERHWTRHQTAGELDDVKLIDGNFQKPPFCFSPIQLTYFLFVCWQQGCWGRKRFSDEEPNKNPRLGPHNSNQKSSELWSTYREACTGISSQVIVFFSLVCNLFGAFRFNGYDGRLDRELEAAVLVMEAFQGFDDKIQYDIMGHSGEAPSISFVKLKEPPKNNKERLDVIRVI
jgi:hypothetical protein